MTEINLFGFSVDDIGLDGYSTEQHLNNALEFCAENKVKATLFAVPLSEGKRLDKRRGYVSILQKAVHAGHEVAQHGLEHDRFEVGIPPEMVLRLPHEGPARKYLAEHRKDINASHSVKNIRKKLSSGRKILEDVIGCPVKGFRSPALQSCENMFIALAEENYQYDSSAYLQKAAWDIINGIDYNIQEITRQRFDQLQTSESVRELPLTAEYTWYLGKNKFEACLNLAIHDFESCMKAGIPFVSLCHVSPLQEGEDTLGFELYRKLFEHVRKFSVAQKAEIQLHTLSEISDKFFKN